MYGDTTIFKIRDTCFVPLYIKKNDSNRSTILIKFNGLR